MGLLRRVADKVKGKLGGGPAPQPTATPRPPDPATAPEQALEGTLECGAQELKERLEAGEFVVIVEVRPASALAGGSLSGARHIPLDEMEARWQELAKADEIVCVCKDGQASGQAARLLRRKGLINATRMEGGVDRWTAIGGALFPLG